MNDHTDTEPKFVVVDCWARAGHCWAAGKTYPSSHRCGLKAGHAVDHVCRDCGRIFNNRSDFTFNLSNPPAPKAKESK